MTVYSRNKVTLWQAFVTKQEPNSGRVVTRVTRANQAMARFCKISKAGRVLPSSTSKNAPPPVLM